jgi:hypothetical protein
VVAEAKARKNPEDHSSERTEKGAQKGFARADNVKDVRFADSSGVSGESKLTKIGKSFSEKH